MKKFLLLKGDSQEGIVEFNSIEDAQKYADNPSKILKREEIMSKLEEAAKSHAGLTPDVLDIKNLRDLRTISARKSLQRYNSFIEGAKWQKDNMWISVEEFGYPPYDKQCEIDKRKRYLLRFVSGSISQTVSYKVGYLARGNRFVGEMDWVSVTHWMPIPEIKKGE